MLKTSKPTQEPAQSGRGGEGRGGEGVNKVLQPAQSVRLKASINDLCFGSQTSRWFSRFMVLCYNITHINDFIYILGMEILALNFIC